MKNAILVFAVLLGTFAQAQSTSKKQLQKTWTKTIYQFKVEDLYGKTFDFATLKGKKY
jgi:glutathione peroxidase